MKKTILILCVGLLSVVRGRYGTAIADHSNGDQVLIISRPDIVPMQHAHFLAGNDGQFKLTVGAQQVGDVDPFDVTFVGSRW
jgi:hypothetical protein